ncbi:hypothetical protein HZY93_00630 [Streptococcus danieliae]|uniref:Uncharacterized protein n=1 Tax=Streptococcus danieliae TaxID=747656 RepID=A0A7Z0RQ09_9STRE|nr:hypothetical protein [Streptococcus danieliae]MBF0716571.1 hypothetical protein [Streptococcus danieliae]NYS48501.1 hypothetical protein [Streptococcus danieliae]
MRHLKTLACSLVLYGILGSLLQTLDLFSFHFSLFGVLAYALGSLLYSLYIQQEKGYLLVLAAIGLMLGFTP